MHCSLTLDVQCEVQVAIDMLSVVDVKCWVGEALGWGSDSHLCNCSQACRDGMHCGNASVTCLYQTCLLYATATMLLMIDRSHMLVTQGSHPNVPICDVAHASHTCFIPLQQPDISEKCAISRVAMVEAVTWHNDHQPWCFVY